MKSPLPIKWRRRRKDAGKGVESLPGYSKFAAAARGGADPAGKELPSSNSCDDTHLSHGSTVTGDQHHMRRQISVDAPGWVRQATPSFEQSPTQNQNASAHYRPTGASFGEAPRGYHEKAVRVIADWHPEPDASEGSGSGGTWERVESPDSASSSEIFVALSEDSSEDTEDDGPPPDFQPRKEVRDAFRYHEKLGRTLVLLAVDGWASEGLKLVHSASTETESTVESTLDSSRLQGCRYVAEGCRLGASHSGDGYTAAPSAEMVLLPFAAHFDQLECGLQPAASADSGVSTFSYSTKSSGDSRSRIERHLSFLEGHMLQRVHSSESPASGGDEGREELFFPGADDLPSPTDDAGPMEFVSPPNTPVGAEGDDGWGEGGVDRSDSTVQLSIVVEEEDFESPETEDENDDNTVPQDELDAVLGSQDVDTINDDDCTISENESGVDLGGSDVAVEGARQIKDDTSTMMRELTEQIRADVQQTMEKELEQHRTRLATAMSEMSQQLEKVAKQREDKENRRPQLASQPSQDSRAVAKELEKSLQSMEKSLLAKLSSQMNRGAGTQQKVMEALIEERVCKAVAGSSLEMKLAVQEVKKESERASKAVLREIRTPPRERTPPRARTPPRGGSTKASPFGPRVGSGGKGSNPPWARGNSSPVLKKVAQPKETTLEDSFADTMKVLDEFVDDCDDLANDFDKIVYRMQECDAQSDPECDSEDEFMYLRCAN